MHENRLKTYCKLFLKSFAISAFTFGGGYVVIPMMHKYFVKGMKVITEQQLLDMAAISQSTPGAIAVNLAVLVGYRVAGLMGAIICCVGTVLPPLIILGVISTCYQAFRASRIISAILKGMEAGVAAIIVDLVITMAQNIAKEKKLLFTLMVPATFLLSFVFSVNVVLILLGCAALCLAEVYLEKRRERVKCQ